MTLDPTQQNATPQQAATIIPQASPAAIPMANPVQSTTQAQTPVQEPAIKPEANADEMPAWAKALTERLDALTSKSAEQAAQEKAAKEKAEEDQATQDGTLAEVLEKRKSELEKEKQTLRAERIQTALERAGVAAGIKDFEYLKLVDRAKIQTDEAGNITGAADVITQLKEKHPTLFNSVNALESGKATPSPLAGGPASSTQQQSQTLTPEQQKLYDNYGWKVCGGRAKRGNQTVTFHEVMLDPKFSRVSKLDD